jgi:ABC-type amino acid transport substrate-binding protein
VPVRFHAAFLVVAAVHAGSAAADAPLRVGVRSGFPLASVQPSGDMAGLYVELLEAIAAQTHTRFQIELLPFPRLRQYLKDGNLTAALAVPNSEMLDDAVAVGDVIDFDVIALGRAGHTVHAIEELKGKTICLTRGSSLVPELYADKRYQLREVSDHESCPKMLDAGRVDYIISLPIGLKHLLAKGGKSLADYGMPYVIKQVPVQLLVSRPHAKPALMQSLRQALDRVKGDGTVGAIQARYEKLPP